MWVTHDSYQMLFYQKVLPGHLLHILMEINFFDMMVRANA
jgi:hypothetical protein